MIENVMFGILRIADASRKIIDKRNRIVHSLTKERSDLPVLNQKRKRKNRKVR